MRPQSAEFETTHTERSDDLLMLSHEPMFAWKLDGAIEFWNAGAERLYGFAPNEAVGHSSHALLQTKFPIRRRGQPLAIKRLRTGHLHRKASLDRGGGEFGSTPAAQDVNVTLRQLRYFDALVQSLHFGRAAKKCSISQPALSMQIQELEREIGTALVERRRQGIQFQSARKAD
jgi:regulatory helix-turn-helix LysR family protein/PAS domain-containing protein